MFQEHLADLVAWDEVTVVPAQEVPVLRGRRPEQGRYEDELVLLLAPFRITISAPNDPTPQDHDRGIQSFPCGNILIEGKRGGKINGPLDPVTWSRVAAFIKHNRKDLEDGRSGDGGSSW